LPGQLNAIANLKTPLAWLAAALGLGLIDLGFVQTATLAVIAIGGMGLSGGIVGVLVMTWLQQQTAFHMQGRMMSLTMFAAVALDPLSHSIHNHRPNNCPQRPQPLRAICIIGRSDSGQTRNQPNQTAWVRRLGCGATSMRSNRLNIQAERSC
jgi:hypothetical protein